MRNLVFHNRRLHTIVVVLLAIAPCLASATMTAAGPSERPAADARERNPLVFKHYLLNTGPHPIAPRAVFTAPFLFRNLGSQAVTITGIRPACGCITTPLDKKVYEPGESGRLEMRIATASQEPGDHDYRMTVAYSDGAQNRELELAVKVVLPRRQVRVKPRSLLFYQLGESESVQEITVGDFRARKLNITEVTCTSDALVAAVDNQEDTRDGARLFTVRVTAAAQVPAGRTQANIIIATDDTEFPQLVVPVILEGRQNSGASEPARLVLSDQASGAATGSLDVKIPELSDARQVTGVRTDPAFIQADYEVTRPGILRVSATAPENRQPVTLRGHITIDVNGRSAAVKVPVTITAQPTRR